MVRIGRLTGWLALCGLSAWGCSTPTHEAGSDALWSIERWKAEGTGAVLIDVRKEADYAAGHLPGAHQVWRNDIESPDYPYGGMAASAERMREVLDSLGVQTGQQVVVYDGVGGCDAARFWWLLQLYGHDAVALMDGGPKAWVHGGDALDTAEPPVPKRSGFAFASAPEPNLLATVADVQSAAAQGITLVDTRTADEHTGRRMKRGAVRAGRIPQSAHYNWGNAVDLNGISTLKSVADVRWDLQQAGIDLNAPLITYCHTGVRSAHTTFVLRELIGIEEVANYDGSWTEWSHMDELPIVADQPVNPAL